MNGIQSFNSKLLIGKVPFGKFDLSASDSQSFIQIFRKFGVQLLINPKRLL